MPSLRRERKPRRVANQDRGTAVARVARWLVLHPDWSTRRVKRSRRRARNAPLVPLVFAKEPSLHCGSNFKVDLQCSDGFVATIGDGCRRSAVGSVDDSQCTKLGRRGRLRAAACIYSNAHGKNRNYMKLLIPERRDEVSSFKVKMVYPLRARRRPFT